MTIRLGDLAIERIEEFCMPSVSPAEFLVGMPAAAIQREADWFLPWGADAASGRLVTSVHSWLVRTRHHTVLIDTCYGNHKNRPDMLPGHHLKTPWLDRLAEHGVTPNQIDFVMCTHLHADHVGWNTQLIDGRWVPTFPSARYVFARREFDHWDPACENAVGYGQQGVFVDSVLPCAEAGLVTLVDDGYTIDDALTVEAAPGHTIGHTLIRAKSAGVTGLFTGDIMHTPLQVAYPQVNSVACELPDIARATRHRVLTEAADHGHLLLPTHFPPPHYGYVDRLADGFRYRPAIT